MDALQLFQLFIPALWAFLACVLGGFATGIVGVLVLTNFFKVDYESAGRRSFVVGAIVTAVAIVAAALLTASTAGGFLPAFILIAPSSVIYALAAAVVVLLCWGALILF
ncbi:hypothetical protein BH11CYA1_BH11CYA1_17610 [soil metagenome]